MHKILQELRAQMESSEDKCLAAGESGELLFSSQKQGIAPLLDLYQQYPGAAPYICDRVFGKAAVFVAALCGRCPLSPTAPAAASAPSRTR